jgi:hypothetical protein
MPNKEELELEILGGAYKCLAIGLGSPQERGQPTVDKVVKSPLLERQLNLQGKVVRSLPQLERQLNL